MSRAVPPGAERDILARHMCAVCAPAACESGRPARSPDMISPSDGESLDGESGWTYAGRGLCAGPVAQEARDDMSQAWSRRGLVVSVSVSLYLLAGATCFCMPNWETYGAAGNAVATDSKGRIVVGGHSLLISRFETATLWRYTEDGSLDVTFGASGSVVLGTGQAASTIDTVDTLQDGRIQAAGTAVYGQGDDARLESVVYRLLPDGSPDASFGTNGSRVVDDAAQTEFDLGRYMAIDDRGRIVSISGYASDGTPELHIGVNGGTASRSVDPSARSSSPFRGAVIVDRAGRILVAGGRPNGMMAVWRFNEDGKPDLRFGEAGCASYDASASGTGPSEANAIVVQADGMILIAGSSEGEDGELDVAVWRLQENGTLDKSFNEVGYAVRDARGGTALRDAAYGLALDSNGRILVTGQSVLGSLGQGTYMILWRFNSDGVVDTSFGRGGLVVAPASRTESE